MAGVIVIAVVFVLVVPVALFVGGAVWSALVGQSATADAERRYQGTEHVEHKLW